MRMYRSWLLALLLAAAGLPGLAQAASITVDESTCTLANAITAANDNIDTGGCVASGTYGDDTITLDTNVTLNAALPEIITTITIEGAGHTIDGAGGNFSILRVSSTGDLTLNQATVTGANKITGGGGGIFNDGILTLNNATVSGNTISDPYLGGGIHNGGVSVTLNNSTVSGNTSISMAGGGISNYTGLLTLNSSTISENSGGGIFNPVGTVTLINSTINGNTSTSNNYSGGIENYGTVTGTNSTISGNTGGSAGGVYNYNEFTLTNSTISGNTASSGSGGGILNTGSTGILTLTNCTISGNTTLSGSGGGIRSDSTSTTVLQSSLISGNTAGTSGNEVSGILITADSFNVFGHSNETSSQAFYDGFTPGSSDVNATSDGGGTPTALTSILNTTLADNGGLTETLALIAGSPAIDLDATCNGGLITTDQRGYGRPVGSGCDAGAFEYGALPVTKKGKLIPVYKLLLLKDGE